MVSLVGFFIAALVFIFLKPYIIEQAEGDSSLFDTYFFYVVPLIFFSLFFMLFDTYYRALYDAVKGIVAKEVIQRVLILAVIVLYFFGIIDFHTAVILYCIALISPTILLFVSLVNSGQFTVKPDFDFIDKRLSREIFSVGFFGIIASFSGVLVLNIDVIMVNHMLGLKAAGIYTITFFFGTLVLVPLRTMGKISSVVIADAWKNNDRETINSIYRKSSLSLSVIGILLFIGIWGNIDNVFYIIKEDYLPGKMVILYIGIANLFDIALGVSPHIIVNSRYYKYMSYILLGFAIILVLSNWILIPVYGIVGAAIASLISKFIINLVKFIFLYRKFGFQPFTTKFLFLIIIGFLTYWASTLVPPFSNFIIDIIIRSIVILILFMIPVYFLNISEDINERIDNVLLKLKLR